MKGKFGFILVTMLIMLIASTLLLSSCDSEDVTMSPWTISKSPTADAEGEISRTSKSGDMESRAIPKLNEDDYRYSRVESTCVQNGMEKYSITIDGEELTFSIELPLIPHNYIFKHDALKHYTECTICGDITNVEEHVFASTTHVCKCGAVEETIHNNYEYLYDAKSDSYEIIRYHGNDANVLIPTTYNGKKVTKLGNYLFENNLDIKNVDIPKGIESIGKGVFHNCRYLCNVNIDDSVKYIGADAFSGIGAMLAVRLPKYLTEIPDRLFKNTRLYTVDIPDGITAIGDEAYMILPDGNPNVTIPRSVKSIGDRAFYHMPFNEIIIPESVIKIGKEAITNYGISGNIKLEVAKIPSTWEQFTDLAQDKIELSYNNITTNSDFDYVLVDNKAHITNYKNVATDIVVPSQIDGYEVETIGLTFNNNSSLTGITLPSTIKEIPDYAFQGCINTANIELPDTITRIGDNAFQACTKVKSIVLPNSLEEIGTLAFSICSKLTSIKVPNSVRKIGLHAFEHCCELTSIELSNQLTVLPEGIFAFCGALRQCIIPESVEIIENNAFILCDRLENVYIPKSVKYIDITVFAHVTIGCKITIDKDNPVYYTSGNAIIERDTHRLVVLLDDKIPSDVKIIGTEAILDLSDVEYLIIPDTVEKIEKLAFYYCNTPLIYFMATEPNKNWEDPIFVGAKVYLYSAVQPTTDAHGFTGYWHYDSDGVTPIAW